MHHEGALRASLRAEYGLDLRQVIEGRMVPPGDLADLVMWLPPGCALWRDFGGPAALSDLVHELRRIDFGIRVLAYYETGGKGRKPVMPDDPPYAHERRAREATLTRKADRYFRRQRRARADRE